MNESFIYAVQALVLAVIFIYMILASQFGSFLQPLAIMDVPATHAGGRAARVAAVRQHAQHVLDHRFHHADGPCHEERNPARRLREPGTARHPARRDGQRHPMTRTDALLEAARVRLRPILMTTLAMIFGMLPLALGLGEGGEQRGPLGQTVIGGVITSSLLTLVVVPVAYTVLDDFGAWVTRKWRRGAKGKTLIASPERSRDIPAEVDRVP